MNLLLIAYKIEKDKGSEDGTGYEIARLMAGKVNALHVITRANNISKLKNDPEFENVVFIPVDVPRILSFYKKGGKGIILYYWLWQFFTGLKIRELEKHHRYEVIHQLNFHATWAPHFIRSKTRIIWGPLTRHPSIPWEFWHESIGGFIKEIIKRIVKCYFHAFDPFLVKAIRHSDRILLGENRIEGNYRKAAHKVRLMPQARTSFPLIQEKSISSKFTILFIGRFVSLKGCVPAMEAIALFLNRLPKEKQRQISVIFVGEGPLQTRLQDMADKIKAESSCDIVIEPWRRQQDLLALYQSASLFLFPSLEGQGLVVAEALSQGCPVLCLEDTGPHSVAHDAAETIPRKQVSEIVPLLADRLYEMADEYWNRPDLYRKRIDKALQRAEYLTWPRMASELMECYHE